jgi:hypothetical protein
MERVQLVKKQVHDRSDYLKFFPDYYEFCMQDFFDACPYTMEQLQSRNKKDDLKCWRSIGMFYHWMINNNFMWAAREFCRDHSTAIHSVKMIYDAMDGYNIALKERVDMVVNSNEYKIYATDDIHKNEVLALILMENESLARFRK